MIDYAPTITVDGNFITIAFKNTLAKYRICADEAMLFITAIGPNDQLVAEPTAGNQIKVRAK